MSASRRERTFVGLMILVARYVVREVVRLRTPQMAAALSYRTLFSLVPILVLVLVSLSTIYGEGGIRRVIDWFSDYSGLTELRIAVDPEDEGGATLEEVPGARGAATQGEATPEDRAVGLSGGPAQPSEASGQAVAEGDRVEGVSEWIEEFVGKATDQITELNFGLISLVSFLVFLYAALSLLIQVESSFNVITGAPRGRRWMTRITTYFTALVLGMIVPVGSILLTEASQDQLENLPTGLWWLSSTLEWFTKVGLTWLLLLVVYLRMPNTRVRLLPAVVGAVIAAVLWELAKAALSWYVVSMFSGQAEVYGSLALVPLLLFWVYVTWQIVLLGLVVAATMQRAKLGELLPLGDADRDVFDTNLTTLVCVVLAREFNRGNTPTAGEIAERLGVPGWAASRVLAALVADGVVHRVEQVDDEDPLEYALSMPASRIRIDRLVRVGDEMTPMPKDSEARAASQRLLEGACAHAEGTTVEDLLSEKINPKDGRRDDDGAGVE